MQRDCNLCLDVIRLNLFNKGKSRLGADLILRKEVNISENWGGTYGAHYTLFRLLCEKVTFLCALALYLDIAHTHTINLAQKCACFLWGNFKCLCDFACEFWL